MLKQRHYIHIYLITIFTLSYILQGCATNRVLQSTISTPDQPNITLLNTKYIAIHATLGYRDGLNHYKYNVKIHIQRDNIIWFSITHGWGIELIRGKITPDRVELINHAEKSYQIYEYPSLQARWQMPCNYTLLQAILLGELPNTGTQLETRPSGKHITVQQQQEHWKFLATIHRDTYKLASLTIIDNLTFNKGCIFYEYKKGYTQNFLFCKAKGYFRKFNLTLQYKKVILSKQPLMFPFKIPQQYDKL